MILLDMFLNATDLSRLIYHREAWIDIVARGRRHFRHRSWNKVSNGAFDIDFNAFYQTHGNKLVRNKQQTLA